MAFPSLMDDDERLHYQDWLAGVLADDTDGDFEELRRKQEAAVWWAVESFGITYQDVIRSWILVAGFLIEEGMDN